MLFIQCFSGNVQSLKIDPERNNIKVRDRIIEFFNEYYVAQNMTLAVLSNGIQLFGLNIRLVLEQVLRPAESVVSEIFCVPVVKRV
jgi:hypothetical protein